MSPLGPQIVPEVLSHCQKATAEISQAFSRAFDSVVEASVGRTAALSFSRMRDELAPAGLAIVLHVGDLAVAILVPAAGELLPSWCSTPDEAGHEKLRTLAQELSLLVLPETYVPNKYEAVHVSQLAAALQTAGAEEASAVVRLTLKSEGKESEALIVWPLTHAANLVHPPEDKHEQTAADEPDAVDADRPTDDEPGDDGMEIEVEGTWATGAAEVRLGPSLRDLPLYTRSLLKIRVPISVTLAAKKQPVAQILEIGPGSILQFEKSCEDMLDLNVSNLPIARGEAVKVGDYFGLRVTSLILPGERFKPLRPPQQETAFNP
jgi:flagellar motor switch/type III secretory pathway protein FliN